MSAPALRRESMLRIAAGARFLDPLLPGRYTLEVMLEGGRREVRVIEAVPGEALEVEPDQ